MTRIPNDRIRRDLGTTGAPKKFSDTVTAKIQRMAPLIKAARKGPKR